MKRTIYLNDTTTHNQRPITPECSSFALEEQIMVMEGQKQKSEYPPSNAPILASQKATDYLRPQTLELCNHKRICMRTPLLTMILRET